jgi:hypothetical protein
MGDRLGREQIRPTAGKEDREKLEQVYLSTLLVTNGTIPQSGVSRRTDHPDLRREHHSMYNPKHNCSQSGGSFVGQSCASAQILTETPGTLAAIPECLLSVGLATT